MELLTLIWVTRGVTPRVVLQCSGSGDAAGMPLERWRVTCRSTITIAARDSCKNAARAWCCCVLVAEACSRRWR